jgi:uncharacterized RDD family membrane protein YckC
MENNLYLSRFWTRIWALLIDTIILGIFGFILGLTFKNFFISLGGNARIIGWIIALVYFTILNSKINDGKTFGKKMMNIQVADIYGNPISLKISFVRAFILITPFFLNDFRIPGTNLFSVITIIQSIIIFTFGIGIILFYIINKENRQSIHDIIAKTYVVQDYRNDEVTLMPKSRQLPFYILGVLFLVISTLTVYNFNNNSKISKLIPVYENILKQDNISDASVFMNLVPLIDSVGTKHYIYTVTIETNKNIENKTNIEDNISNPELKQTVETFINSKAYETDNDILSVVVNSGFDIGIARQTYSFNIYKSIYQWKEIYSQ